VPCRPSRTHRPPGRQPPNTVGTSCGSIEASCLAFSRLIRSSPAPGPGLPRSCARPLSRIAGHPTPRPPHCRRHRPWRSPSRCEMRRSPASPCCRAQSSPPTADRARRRTCRRRRCWPPTSSGSAEAARRIVAAAECRCGPAHSARRGGWPATLACAPGKPKPRAPRPSGTGGRARRWTTGCPTGAASRRQSARCRRRTEAPRPVVSTPK
jgi:hypothetical protein